MVKKAHGRERIEVSSDFFDLAERIKMIARNGDSVKTRLQYSLPGILSDISYFHEGDIKSMVLDAAKTLLDCEASDQAVNWWLEQLAANAKEFAREVIVEAISVFVVPPIY